VTAAQAAMGRPGRVVNDKENKSRCTAKRTMYFNHELAASAVPCQTADLAKQRKQMSSLCTVSGRSADSSIALV